MSGQLNIPIDAGFTRRVAFTVTVDGNPANFTGCTITFYSPGLTKELEIGDFDPEIGTPVFLNLSTYETRRLPRSSYAIGVRYPSGDEPSLLKGHLLVNAYPGEVA